MRQRIFIHGAIYDEFATLFAQKVKQLKVGNGCNESVDIGPLIHGRAVSKVQAHVKDAKDKGGIVIAGGQPRPDLGPIFLNQQSL